MTFLVTGGAGFIGSHLCSFLLAQGASVVAIDNLQTGALENVSDCLKNSHFEFIQADVKDAEVMRSIFPKVDFIFHLAAPVGVKFILHNPVTTILDSVKGTERVLTLALEFQKPVLLASTSEVYGKHLDLLDPSGISRLKEDDYRIEGTSTNHRWAYANVKSLTEFLAFAFMREHGLKVIITRFFNTAGPRQKSDYGMVIPNFIQAGLQGKALEIYGTGEQKRSFIHIQDTIRALWTLIHTEAAYGQVYNIGSPEEITIKALAERVRILTGGKSPIQNLSYEEAYGTGFEEMNRRTADISRLQKMTGFELEFSLDDILQDVLQYESERLKNAHDSAQ
jgi:UDP-glucose 4-epimerase